VQCWRIGLMTNKKNKHIYLSGSWHPFCNYLLCTWCFIKFIFNYAHSIWMVGALKVVMLLVPHRSYACYDKLCNYLITFLLLPLRLERLTSFVFLYSWHCCLFCFRLLKSLKLRQSGYMKLLHFTLCLIGPRYLDASLPISFLLLPPLAPVLCFWPFLYS
jgi:hypothetical protein